MDQRLHCRSPFRALRVAELCDRFAWLQERSPELELPAVSTAAALLSRQWLVKRRRGRTTRSVHTSRSDRSRQQRCGDPLLVPFPKLSRILTTLSTSRCAGSASQSVSRKSTTGCGPSTPSRAPHAAPRSSRSSAEGPETPQALILCAAMDLAKRSLGGPELVAGELRALLSADVPLLPLLHEAHTVRHHFFGNRVQVHILNNCAERALLRGLRLLLAVRGERCAAETLSVEAAGGASGRGARGVRRGRVPLLHGGEWARPQRPADRRAGGRRA